MSATRIELRADYFQGWLAEARFYVNVGAGCHGNGISLKKNALTCLFHTCTHKQLLLTLVIIIIIIFIHKSAHDTRYLILIKIQEQKIANNR